MPSRAPPPMKHGGRWFTVNNEGGWLIGVTLFFGWWSWQFFGLSSKKVTDFWKIRCFSSLNSLKVLSEFSVIAGEWTCVRFFRVKQTIFNRETKSPCLLILKLNYQRFFQSPFNGGRDILREIFKGYAYFCYLIAWVQNSPDLLTTLTQIRLQNSVFWTDCRWWSAQRTWLPVIKRGYSYTC